MGRVDFSSSDLILHECAPKGVENGVEFALSVGANVNAFDPQLGKTLVAFGVRELNTHRLV